VIALSLLLAFGITSDRPSRDSDPDTFLDHMRAHYERIHHKLDRGCATYELFLADESSETLVKHYQQTDAYRPGQSYFQIYHFGANPLDSSSSIPAEDPIQNWVLLRDGVRFHVWPVQGVARISELLPSSANVLSIDGYFSAIGIPLDEERTKLYALPKDFRFRSQTGLLAPSNFFFPYALRDPAWRRIESDAIDGVVCVVLRRSVSQDTSDTLWVDPKFCFAIHRRRIEQGAGRYLDIASKQFRLYAGDVALPSVVHIDRMTVSPHEIREYRLLDVQVAKAPEELFQYHYPEGCIVRDGLRDKKYVMPGGGNILDRLVARARKYYDYCNQNEGSSTLLWRKYGRDWLLPCLPALLLAISFVCLLARRPHRDLTFTHDRTDPPLHNDRSL
jgi:hypothetical protein